MKFSVRGQLLFKQHCLNFVYVITLFLPNLGFLFVEKNAVFTYNVMILLAWVPHENTRINTKYEHDGWNGTQGDCLTNHCMCRRLSLSSVVKWNFCSLYKYIFLGRIYLTISNHITVIFRDDAAQVNQNVKDRSISFISATCVLLD